MHGISLDSNSWEYWNYHTQFIITVLTYIASMEAYYKSCIFQQEYVIFLTLPDSYVICHIIGEVNIQCQVISNIFIRQHLHQDVNIPTKILQFETFIRNSCKRKYLQWCFSLQILSYIIWLIYNSLENIILH